MICQDASGYDYCAPILFQIIRLLPWKLIWDIYKFKINIINDYEITKLTIY